MARILVPFNGGTSSICALEAACRTAGAGGDEVHVAYVIRVPQHRPISADLATERAHADVIFAQARAIAERYGACLTDVLVEAREIGRGIVAAAEGCDMVVMGQRRHWHSRALPHRIVRHVKTHVCCQVIVLTTGEAPELAPWLIPSPARQDGPQTAESA